jgi:outer membrane protein insertion porin family
MNRLALIILAAIQLLVVNAGAQAQTTSSSVPVIDCTAASDGVATLKRQQPTRDKRSVEDQTVVENERTPSFQTNFSAAPKPRKVEFFGLTALKESEALKLLCERQLNTETTKSAASALTEILTSRGYANAEVQAFAERRTFRFFVNEGIRVPLAELRFEGNKVFSSRELLALANGCLARLGEGTNGYDSEKVEYCGRKVVDHIRNAGYLESKLRISTRITGAGHVVSFAVDEGALYRLGKIKIEGAEVFTAEDIRAKLGLRGGDIAKGDSISMWLFEDLKKMYGEFGFIEYTAEVTPTFKREQGMVDLKIDIEEGKQFLLRSITFAGDLIKGMNLEDLMVLKPGDIYNHRLFLENIAQLNNTGVFEPVNADRDVEMKTDSEEALVQVVIKLKKRK